MSLKNGIVYLVGAGCGDYDLITLRGKSLLERCDVVVYDSLIDNRLLNFVPDSAERICVGKRSGRHSETQENINRILVSKAGESKTVVRLKGGDPFVFGRGGEEILELKKNNIEYEVVPGITSAVAVPELAGIPVTHRNISRSFHVVTGHTSEDFLPDKMRAYAALDGTLVFLMGLSHLKEITSELEHYGKSGLTHAAVISNGAGRRQRIVRGTLQSIYNNVQEAGISAPAVIVIGDTAGFDFSESVSYPLKNISVTVTGTKSLVAKLTDHLSGLGAYVEPLDFLKVKEYENNEAFELSLSNICDYSWVVLTSVNGAELFFNKIRSMNTDVRTLAGVKFAVVGSGTAEILKKHGVFPDLIPDQYTTRSLAERLSEAVGSNDRLLVLRAEKSSEQLTEILDKHNADYDEIKIYDVVSDGSNPYTVNTDFVTFASASGVKTFFECGYTVSDNTRIVCIGDVTADMLQRYVSDGFRIAKTCCAAGISDMIKEIVHEKI